jgi:hypothetical protein
VAKATEKGSYNAAWGSVDDHKLTIPAEITDYLVWFTPAQKMKVSIDLSRRGMIIVRNLADVAQFLVERRQTILEESEDGEEDALRRVALTYHFFREASLYSPRETDSIEGRNPGSS